VSYTRADIERVAVNIFASVTDVNDGPSQQRMRAITEIFATMLSHNTQSVDEATLDDNTNAMLGYYLKPDGNVRGPFMP
jgi:hypothetical protein